MCTHLNNITIKKKFHEHKETLILLFFKEGLSIMLVWETLSSLKGLLWFFESKKDDHFGYPFGYRPVKPS